MRLRLGKSLLLWVVLESPTNLAFLFALIVVRERFQSRGKFVLHFGFLKFLTELPY